jgi:hypothetical protein
MHRLSAILLGLSSVSAEAAPVYLHCQFNAPVDPAPMDLTLNEESSTVQYVFPDIGYAGVAKAIFTADSVAFNGFTIDRTNLQYTRSMPDRVDHGRCSLVQVKRAF